MERFSSGAFHSTSHHYGRCNPSCGYCYFLDFFFGERLGWGTIRNMVFIGTFINLIMLNNWFPIPENIAVTYGMMIVGMAIMALATYFYLSAQMEAGLKDGLMIAITKWINLSVGWIRNMIEVVVLIAGYFMGGSVGLGTVVVAILFGRFIQFVFKLFKSDVRQVKHHYIDRISRCSSTA